jgi:hypothetical protein
MVSRLSPGSNLVWNCAASSRLIAGASSGPEVEILCLDVDPRDVDIGAAPLQFAVDDEGNVPMEVELLSSASTLVWTT